MADYNWEMTGAPDAVTIATDPEAVADWNRYVARTTGDYGTVAPSSPLAPQPIANPVYEDPTYWNSGKVAYQTGNNETAYAPSFLRPQEYVSNELAAPYSKAELSALVDPNNIRLGYGNTPYAGIRGGAGGEYVVDPKTNRFLLDKSGNPIPVPQAPDKQGGFDTLMTNYVIPAMLAAGAVGTGLGAAGLIGGGGAAGGTATGTGITGGFGGSQGLLSAAGAPSGIAATQSAAGLGGAGTGIISGLIPTSIGMEGVAGAGSLAGILGSQTAAGLGGALAGIGLSLTPEQLAAYEAGALPATSATPGIVDTLSKAASALTPAGALTTAALGSTALKAITGTPTATPTPTTTGTPSTYAPRGQVGYDPLLSLLAPRLIPRNQYSLLG